MRWFIAIGCMQKWNGVEKKEMGILFVLFVYFVAWSVIVIWLRRHTDRIYQQIWLSYVFIYIYLYKPWALPFCCCKPKHTRTRARDDHCIALTREFIFDVTSVCTIANVCMSVYILPWINSAGQMEWCRVHRLAARMSQFVKMYRPFKLTSEKWQNLWSQG